MHRRDFMKGSLTILGSSALGAGVAGCTSREVAGPGKQPRLTIDYPQKNIPDLSLPPCHGSRYEDTVPDTLDIASRCELAINALTGITDPEADYEVYWQAEFYRNPPVMMHDHNDWVESVEGFMEALPLLRNATGSDLNTPVDLAWMQVNLKTIGPDGLTYEILNGWPWSRVNPWSFEFIWKPDGRSTKTGDPSVALATTAAKCGRIIGTMAVYYLRDKNPVWKETCERMIQRLAELAVDRGSFAYIPHGAFAPFARFGPQAQMPTGYDAVDYGNVRMIQGLSQYYRVTGYEPAIKLAAKLAAFGMEHAQYYDERGRFLCSAVERDALMHSPRLKVHYPEARDLKLGGHFHNHTIGLLSILEYAVTARDKPAQEFVRAGYEWAKGQGSSLVGFFPELAIENKYYACESCALADMVAIGVLLSRAGVGDYWDDIDRWVRNQFAEQQLTNGDWIYELAKTQERKPVAFNETADRLVARNLGTFAGWASGNEWVTQIGIQQCCLGNSARALYYVLESIVQRDPETETVRVNLLMNRATPWVDIYSHIPYEGRVELKIKQPCKRLLVRAPEWVKGGSREIACKTDGVAEPVAWQGRYIEAGYSAPGNRIVLTFPIPERTVRETIGNVPYRLTLKGSTVTSIDPPGKIGPLYERAYYRANQAPLRKVQRFVPEQEIFW
ncbi:MAG TPA: hypothetical protein VFD30_00215 [Terriglobia bacterium]|nr:hypothetical protein [Terriglobia bacterium]